MAPDASPSPSSVSFLFSGAVWSAVTIETGEVVAIKFAAAANGDAEHLDESLLQHEAQALRMLRKDIWDCNGGSVQDIPELWFHGIVGTLLNILSS